MREFEGKKFRTTGNVVQCGYDAWKCQPIYKDEFVPTSSYLKYLNEKQREKDELQLFSLKSKLDYQMKTFGEIDEVDYNNYMSLLSSYNKQIIECRNDTKSTIRLNEKSIQIIGNYNNKKEIF